MKGRILQAGLYGFDDVAEGDIVKTGEACVDHSQIDRFAELTGDRFEIHMDDAAARAHGFPRRVAHGLLILSMVDGLKNRAPAQFRALASLGWDWSFRAPVLAGDHIRASLQITEKRSTKNPLRGLLRLEYEVLNARDETVQDGSNILMVYR